MMLITHANLQDRPIRMMTAQQLSAIRAGQGKRLTSRRLIKLMSSQEASDYRVLMKDGRSIEDALCVIKRFDLLREIAA